MAPQQNFYTKKLLSTEGKGFYLNIRWRYETCYLLIGGNRRCHSGLREWTWRVWAHQWECHTVNRSMSKSNCFQVHCRMYTCKRMHLHITLPPLKANTSANNWAGDGMTLCPSVLPMQSTTTVAQIQHVNNYLSMLIISSSVPYPRSLYSNEMHKGSQMKFNLYYCRATI